MTNEKTISLSERLYILGYGCCPDDLTYTDGRMMIYALGQEGYAVDRLNAKEAAAFCNKLESN